MSQAGPVYLGNSRSLSHRPPEYVQSPFMGSQSAVPKGIGVSQQGLRSSSRSYERYRLLLTHLALLALGRLLLGLSRLILLVN